MRNGCVGVAFVELILVWLLTDVEEAHCNLGFAQVSGRLGSLIQNLVAFNFMKGKVDAGDHQRVH